MKLGTLRYHLGVLSHTHKIVVAGDTSAVRFYENSGAYSTEEQQIHRHLRNETTRKILTALLEKPMAARSDLAIAAGITVPSISWHTKRLEVDRIVIPRRDGRLTVYEIPASVASYLGRQVKAPAAVVSECPGATGNV